MKWFPDRKYIAGGVSGVVAYFLSTYLEMPAEQAMGITGSVWAAVTYFVPPSVDDVLKRVDGEIMDLAEAKADADMEE